VARRLARMRGALAHAPPSRDQRAPTLKDEICPQDPSSPRRRPGLKGALEGFWPTANGGWRAPLQRRRPGFAARPGTKRRPRTGALQGLAVAPLWRARGLNGLIEQRGQVAQRAAHPGRTLECPGCALRADPGYGWAAEPAQPPA
jgi:hypothetical protein